MKTKHLRNVIIAIALVLAGALGTYLLIGSDEEKTEQNVPVNKIELADKIAVAKQKKDTAEVFRLYYDAAQRGDVESQYHLGVCYYSGEGVELSLEESVKWFRKAAEQGYADAQYMCGALSESEEDVAKWYYRAAEQGHTVAQTLLGMCYEEGYGVAQSYDDAEKWYRKAAEQGVEEAKQALEELENERKRKEEYARTHGTINGHDYVDLGLSVKWATCNVGASSPEGYGDYYAWGETATKSSYTEENSTTYGKQMNSIAGNPTWDAARKNWGSPWRLPTEAEFQELIDNCTWEWTTQNGHNGYKVTSKKNGNSIFLPATGWRIGASSIGQGSCGDYWGATPCGFDTDDACILCFFDGLRFTSWGSRYHGHSVRPVCTAGDDSERKADEERERQEVASNSLSTRTINGHDYVDLGLSVKWATCNVGASSPEGYGDYYAWGETATKSSYTEENSTTYGKQMNSIAGNPTWDVACNKWGSPWRLPTKAEFQELIDNCTWEWSTRNGHNGYKVTSKKNGNSIFLPAAGWRDGTSSDYQGSLGNYWSATPYESGAYYACSLYFYEGYRYTNWDYRYYGFSVRPVCTVGDDSERKADEERKRQEAASNSLSTRTFTVNGVSFKMVAVDGGTFTMGATSEQQNPFDSEKTIHNVTLSDYYIGETEVTQALWQAVMGNNPSYFSGSNNPVEEVSYDDCITFINKLNSQLSGQLPSGRKFRLPTEAEWEFAARGGNRSRGNQYSGSNSLGSVAWYDYNSNSQTHPVKQKQANELGLYDMSGNVLEWCYDWYGKYSSSSQTNPKGPSSGSYRVLRGGSWRSFAQDCRVANRNHDTPGYRYNNGGMRLAL